MKIGLTYDLRSAYLAAGYGEEETAEFDRDETIEAIEAAIGRLGYEPDRIGNVQDLARRLARGDRWDLVFNIAEGLRGRARESQVPALLDAFEVPYTFSDPLAMSLTLDKGLAKLVMRKAGLATVDFHLVERPGDVDEVRLPFPVFAKPVAEGTGKGIDAASKIENRPALRAVCERLLARYNQPVLVEAFLPGREFTVGLLGTGADAEVLGTMEVLLRPQAESGVYCYTNKENSEELVDYRLLRPNDDPQVHRTEALALAAWRVLGCRDAGRVDVRCDAAGEPMLMEVNALAGLHPTHSDLPIICGLVGLPFVELIGRIILSAIERQERAEACGRMAGHGV